MKDDWSEYAIFSKKIVFSILISFFITGCTLMQLREETKAIKSSTILAGIVSSPLSSQDMPVVVAAYSKERNERVIVHYATLHELGPYELFVPKGIYNIVAFEDRNKNLIYDKGELAGQYLGAEYVSAPSGGVVTNLDIVISEPESVIIDFPVGSQIPPKKINPFHYTSPGVIVNLDDDVLFSDDYGNKGFWSPVEFFLDVGGNIYFLEEYDPNKIPILFVHGAAGSPQNWRRFFESIDRTRYQPWFFYYPSGAPLDAMSYLLCWKLINLQSKYKFSELYITAHSMGGLVVRSFIVEFGVLFPCITNFISISTPWGGESVAESGVKYSPAVIPAWRDMLPKGNFINSIYSKKMPPTVEHFLLFGHKGNRNILRPNNDEAVTLASQLDQRAQREAKLIYGFNESHVSILSSEQVLSQYNAILTATKKKTEDGIRVPGNKVHVDFLFDIPKELPKPLTTLFLRPVHKKGAESCLFINPEDRGQEYGPFPSGNYEVTLFASAFVPDPTSIMISIGESAVPKVEFLMKPRGQLTGYIVKKEKNTFPAGVYRPPDTEVQIQSITLKGAGITRTLVPLKEKDIRFFDHYLSGTDYVGKGSFNFYGLPAGEYELTINAKGYKQYSEIRSVRPGQYEYSIKIELVKDAIGEP